MERWIERSDDPDGSLVLRFGVRLSPRDLVDLPAESVAAGVAILGMVVGQTASAEEVEVSCICPGCPERISASWASGMCASCAAEDCQHDEPVAPCAEPTFVDEYGGLKDAPVGEVLMSAAPSGSGGLMEEWGPPRTADEMMQHALVVRKLAAADAVADEVAVLVDRKVIDSRSPAADALLDYREPPRSPRSDRIAELERKVALSDELIQQARAKRDELLLAITEHYDQPADDRCWEDDDRLYAAAGLKPCDRRVGDKAAMLANCARFIDRRCEGGGWPSYAELEARVAELQRRLDVVNGDATH